MKKIYTPLDEVELAIIRSMLESADIPYRVVNQYFGSLYIGPAMGNLNSKPVMVPEQYYEEAKEILSGFLLTNDGQPQEEEAGTQKENGIFDDLGELLFSIYKKLFGHNK